MIFSARRTPGSAAAQLRQVRRSLNKPVVSIAQLPVGPASAAIAVHQTSRASDLHFTLAVRCERTRSVIFFAANGDPDPARQSLAGDAALSLAEGMGFLFDEWIATDNPATRDVANRVWGHFVEAAESSAAGHALSISAGPAASHTGADPRVSAIPLTKFRRDLPWSAPEAAGTDSESHLARQRGG
jgi:hypothetical protein